uniref:Uncharacterized protein n=1 Tax=Leptobrachium leishanense TaxID=445787 RepID=A0A8C5R0L0_9ANUR
MASANLGEELDCSICLSKYTDPVMLDCGHNFCQVCISQALDTQEGAYRCPDCRADFQERPKLMRNLKLSNIVERFSHNKRCSVHKKILEYHCLEDDTCICVSCLVEGEHNCHQVELLDEAIQKKQHQLGEALQTLNWGMEDITRSIDMLNESKRELRERTARVTTRFTSFIGDLRKQVDDLEKTGCGELSRREEQVLVCVSARMRELEIKENEALSKMLEVENLRNITDPWILLKIPFHGVDNVEEGCGKSDQLSLDEATLMEVLHDHCKAFNASAINLETRSGFSSPKKIPDISLDLNTAGNSVVVSDDLKRITFSSKQPTRPDHSQRFSTCQALSVGNISKGQYYWEVETSGSGDWKIGVAYPSIEREGPKSFIGANEKSWCMARSAKEFVVTHNSVSEAIKPGLDVCQYGIFLDYSAGQLSFYRLTEPMVHLYTFNATFTEPLHPYLAPKPVRVKVVLSSLSNHEI